VVSYATAALENKGKPVPGQMVQPEATEDCLPVALKRKEVTQILLFQLTCASLVRINTC